MIISPWEIYWILSLDSIKSTFGGLAFVFAIVSIAVIIFSIAFITEEKCTRLRRNLIITICVFIVLFEAFLICATTLVPTTNQAIAMYSIPAIVNNPEIQKEFKELYSGGKDMAKESKELFIETMKTLRHKIETKEVKND